jgi:tRNA (cmo5U34)-methyltransferase
MIKRFNFKNLSDFDKHIELSIPNLNTLDQIFKNITHENAQPESIVLDMGCSTGRFISNLSKIPDCRYIGIDEVDMKNRKQDFEFIKGDVEEDYFLGKTNISFKPHTHKDFISVLVSMFFLQFLGQKKRGRVVEIMKNVVDEGGVVLLAEKVHLDDAKIQQSLHRLHIQEKRKNFTDKEILEKDLQLSISMFCKTESELQDEINYIGQATKVWQSYNFMGYVIKK